MEDQTEDRRAPLDEQPVALATAEATGDLPDEDRRAEEPVAEIEVPEIEPVMSEAEKALHRVHDILDHVAKGCDPADRLLIRELKQILIDHGVDRPTAGE